MIDELSIIIPAYNEEKYLPKLLDSLTKQNYKGKIEIIIVDGNSEDETIKVAKNFKQKIPNLSILALKNRGISYQRNRGAKKAKHKYLLFIDSDMILPRHFLNRFLKRIDTRKQFIATSNIWIAEKNIVTYFFCIFIYLPILFIHLWEKITPGYLLLTTNENHKKINGFRENLKISEDIDYGLRSIENGAIYHMKLYPVALLSARRMHKRGRIKLLNDYFKIFTKIKKYGIEAAGENLEYPFGQFSKP